MVVKKRWSTRGEAGRGREEERRRANNRRGRTPGRKMNGYIAA